MEVTLNKDIKNNGIEDSEKNIDAFSKKVQSKESFMVRIEKKINTSYPDFPLFNVGDTINLYVHILDNSQSKKRTKERLQQHKGIVIKIKGNSLSNRTFTIRKISNGTAVEMTYPYLNPNIQKIKIVQHGKVRRANLTYLRNRYGKAASVKRK